MHNGKDMVQRRCLVALWLLLAAVVIVPSTAGTTDPSVVAWATSTSGGTLNVKWTISAAWQSSNSLNEIDSFRVLVDSELNGAVGAEEISYDVSGLTNNTVYTIQVNATLTSGSSAEPLYSNVISATTLDRSAPHTPDAPKQLTVSGGFIQVSVQQPADTGGVDLLSLTIIVRHPVSLTVVTQQAQAPVNSGTLTYNIYGLDAQTSYRISAFAVNQGDLKSLESDFLDITTKSLQLPGPCPPPKVLNTTGASVALQLIPPLDDGGGRIQGYNVYMATDDAGGFEEVASTIDTDMIDVVEISRLSKSNDNPLFPETKYIFKTVAINLADICISISSSLQVANATEARTTVASLPGPPPSPCFLTATGGMVSMSLMKPANMQGTRCTGFSIMVKDNTGKMIKNSIDVSDDATYDAAHLRANTNYEISAAVITNMGTTSYSGSTAMSSTNPTSPTQPVALTATNITGSSAVMEWALPLDNGGVNISGYTIILISQDSQEERSAVSSPWLLKDLTANTLYTIKVTATNVAKSKGPPSIGATFKTTSPTGPSEPSGISSGFASGGAIEVAWNPPENRGGEPLSSMGYKIAVYTSSSCFDSEVSSCLECNSVKFSAQHYKLLDKPSVCERPTEAECPDGSLDCCLAHEDGVGFSCGRMSQASPTRSVVGTTSTFFKGLNYSSDYYFGVQAINRAGKSTVSTLQQLQTTGQSAPSFPSNIRQISATGGSIQLTWDGPLDTGGGPILGYRVYRNFELRTVGYVMPPYTDCGGMLADSTYVYGVAAVNGSLVEGAMASATLTTGPLSSPLQPLLLLTAAMYNRLQISTNPACDTGGETLRYQYEVKYFGTVVATDYFECCNFVVENLMKGRTYTVTVRVTNSMAISPWTESRFTTTSGNPPTPVASLTRVNTYSAVVSLGSSSTDKETRSYDVYLYLNEAEVQHQTVSCQTDVVVGQYVCPKSLTVETLEPQTEYGIKVKANGGIGSVSSSLVKFTTNGIIPGTFGMSKRDYYADKEGSISTAILRSGGTSGSVDVGVDVIEPNTVLVRCERVASGGCHCTLYLTSSGTASDPCGLTFIDGQESAEVSFSTWNDESAELTPFPVVVAPFGVTLSGEHAALLHNDEYQQSGFVSFSSGPFQVLENSLYAIVDLVRLNGSTGTVSADFESFDISAVAGVDYVLSSGTITMVEQQSETQIWVQLIDNHVFNADKAFGIRLLNQAAQLGAGVLVTQKVVIIDDESFLNAVPLKMESATIGYTTGGKFEIEWANPFNDIAPVLGYMVRVTPVNPGNMSSLYNTTQPKFTLSGLSARSAYRVEIAGWNTFGLGEFSDVVEVATKDITRPGPPLALAVSDVTNINLTLTWEPPRDDGGSVVKGYWVVISGDTDGFTLSKFVEIPTLLLVVKGLSAYSHYTCNVSSATEAFSDNSNAISSAQIIVLTAIGVVPGKPRAVALVEQPRGGTLTFFVIRPQYTGGLVLTMATLYLRKVATDGTDSDAVFTSRCKIDLSDQKNSTCTISNLVATSSYELYATFSNEKGEGASGESKIFQTTSAVDLPSSPLNLRATIVTAGNIKLEWDIPADLGGASDVVGYIVYQKITVSGAAYFTLYDGQDSKERSFVARGLMRESSYAFAVVALNDASFCVDPSLYNLSSFLEVTTLSSSRVSPARDLFIVYRTGGSITLGWKDPYDLAGLPLLKYLVELVVHTNDYELLADTLSSGQTNYSHYGLSGSTNYSYVVTAVNEDGPSIRSAVFTATTTNVSIPGSVQNVNYVNASGGSITLIWDPPQDTGGRLIERYEISRQGRSFYSTTTAFEDHFSLSVNTGYTYTVSAFNGYYRGYAASGWALTGDPSLPDPPQMNAFPFGGRLEVSWAKPENTGGIPISQYLIILFNSDGSTTIDSTTTSTLNYTFWGLLARTHYRLTGKSFNDFGDSALMKYDVTTGPPDAPSAPPQPTANNIQGGRVDIHAERTKYTGGEPVTLILYMDGEAKHSFPADGGDTTIYGLVAETEYVFKVSAKNTVAETRSPAFKLTTTAISTPGQIQNLQLVSVTFSQMELKWDNIQDTGGDKQLQYKVIYVKCSSDGTPTASEQFQIYGNNTVIVDKLDYSSFYNVSVIALTSTSLLGKVSSSILVETQQPLGGAIVAGLKQVTVMENAEFVSIPVERVNGSFGTISYTYMMTDESAFSGVNYQLTGAVLELDTNIQSDVLKVRILNDDVYNPGITFLVTIVDWNTGLETSTRVILEDDGDAGFISFTQPSLTLLENSGIASVDVTRMGGNSPKADIRFVFVQNASSVDRFNLLDSTVTFEVGDTQKTISIEIVNDIEFQLVPDSITIGLEVLDGGVLNGGFSTITLTALDDGDISLPKECVDLRQTSVTGGALGLEWTQPVDRGGADITLSFRVSVVTSDQAPITQFIRTESTVVYGLTQRTSYQVFVQAVNSAGFGVESISLLLSTTSATAPTAPFDIMLISASSSSLLFIWLDPLDDGGSPIVTYTIYKVTTTTSTTSPSSFSSISCLSMTVCSINQLQALTNYSIQIQASSAFVPQGAFSDVVTFPTTSPDYPDPPPIANVTWVSAGAMTIQMFDPVNVGGSNIQEYWLYIRADLDPEFTWIYSGALKEHTVFHLRYQTAYHIKYQVVNSVGPSFDSPIKTYQTLLKSLPSAPLNVGVTGKTGGAITLSWDEPLDIGGRQITGYAIKFVSINGESATMIGYDGKSIPSRQGTVYGLTADTEYAMQVVAYLEVSNCFEAALQAWSSVLQVTTTNATPPGSAPELLAGQYTGGIIQLVWIAPKDQGGVPLTGYALNFVDDVGNSSVLFSTANASIISFVHNDLTANTKYSYTISTSNSAGSSPTSQVLVATTDTITFPSVPLNVQQLTYTTGGAITIGWDRSVDTGGQPIAGYVVYRNSVPVSTTLPPTTRSFINKEGLSASSSYTYTVRTVAQNLMVSMASDNCPAKTTEATKPQKAQSLSTVPGSSYLDVSWIADGDTGGLPILSCDVKLMLGSTLVESVNLKPGTSYLFTGLTASTTYSGYLKCNNDKGTSEELSAELTTANVSVPNAPEMPSVRSIFGGNFSIQVQPPRFTGGSPITSMNVYEYIGGAPSLNVALKISGAQASYTFYGVSASSKYYVACSAINSAGEGPLSAITTIATTPINQPGPLLMAPSFVGATGTSLSFSWRPPADTGGSQTLTYVVRVANGSVDATNPTTELSYTAKQLSYGSSYDFSVLAKNNIGDGAWSPIITATTQPDAAGEFNFAQISVSVLENATQVALVVQRTSGLSGRITLTYSAEKTGAQPATIGSDYAVVSGSSTTTGTIVFESLQSECSIVIFIINDTDYDPDETFAVRITALTSTSVGTPVIGSKNVAVVTIVDDGDAGYISFEKPAYSFAEDARTGTVVIIREYGKSTSITLTFEFWGGTAIPDVDYRKTTTPVVMDNGVTKATLTFSIINDKIFEYPDEYFFIRMSVTGGAILRQSLVRVTILDDGDVSNPGTCPPPELQAVTGGLATFLARLPDHNGSAAGSLSNYVVRLSTETTSIDFNMSATPALSVGNLKASTAYSVIVAPSSPYGLGIFSSPTQFSTTGPSLPGAISSMSVQSKTGGRISLAWSPPEDTGGIPISKYRIDVIGFPELTVENAQPTTQATMYGLAASTPYKFFVQAQNAVKDNDGWGTKSAPFTFSTTVATQPGSLVLSPDPYQNATGGKVYLSWKPPRDTGGLRISSYGIFARSLSRPWFLSATATPTLNPLFSAVETLNASTAYVFFILANNSVPAVSLPGKLSIAEGSTQLSSSNDLSSLLSVGTVITVEDSVFVVNNVSGAATGSIGLMYAHLSTSILSKTGAITGQATSFSELNTDVSSLPDLPPVPELSLATGGMINLVLRSPKDTGGIPILDFALYWNGVKLDGDSYVKTTSKANPLQLTALVFVSRLKSVTSYNVSAVALNSLSLCKFGSVTTGPNGTFTTTTVTAPGSPLLATYRITGGGITMTIVDPRDTGGNDIQLYRLYYKRNGTTDPWQLSYKDRKHQATVARLKNSTEYAFLASVSNRYFDSVNSSVIVVRTLNKSPPGSCEAPTLVNSTGGMLQVEWNFPADDGGSTVTGYYATVASHVDGSGRTTVKTNVTSCVFYRLLADSSYDIVVRAENSNGIGPESAIVTFNTTPATPPVGKIEVIVHRTTGGAAQISFDEPIDLGGATSKDMMYSFYLDRDNTVNMSYSTLEEYSRGNGSSTRRLAETTHRRLEDSKVFSNVVVGDMDPETLYDIQILPISTFSSGGISSSYPVETVGPTIPSAPVSLTLDALTGGSVSLSWGAPVDSGGMALNPYTVSLSNTTSTGPFATVYTGLLRTTSIHNRNASTTYWVRVTAWNDIGESPPSAVLEFSTRSITAPTAPENFGILSVGHDTIECAWDLPTDIGGDKIDGYTVTATTGDPAVSVTYPVTSLSATLIALSVSTSYSVSVVSFMLQCTNYISCKDYYNHYERIDSHEFDRGFWTPKCNPICKNFIWRKHSIDSPDWMRITRLGTAFMVSISRSYDLPCRARRDGDRFNHGRVFY
ncbi:hypothetical protein V7S43_001684 [Phytophthora oleae]|uniref:Fibronectin type-III domain-containing protein n=1 Tax=Phytophthora oleae TaxID=2107226 RepID=A0ABD3GA24_9STRA